MCRWIEAEPKAASKGAWEGLEHLEPTVEDAMKDQRHLFRILVVGRDVRVLLISSNRTTACVPESGSQDSGRVSHSHRGV